jgi:glycosyltransferase involved in cell wall biosynthesis
MTTRKLRVLTMIDHLSPEGGAERVATHLAASLDTGRFESFVCSTRSADPGLQAELTAKGVRVHAFHRRGRADWLPWARLVRLLRTERIDVLHTHKFGSNVWGAVWGVAARLPVVVAHEHTWSFQGRTIRRLLDRHLVARFSDVVVAVSDFDRQRMLELEHLPAAKVVVVANGIPPLPPARGDVRAELGIPAGAPMIGAVAVLRPQKALWVLVEAAARLRDVFPELRVLVAGEGIGDEPARIRALVAERGLTDVVHLLGHRPDVSDILAALDVAVLSSDFEGSPLSVLEYMAAGKPIVATDVGGIPAMVSHARGGLLVPRRDPGALAAAIETLLRDPALRQRMGEHNRERQRLEFDSEASIRRIEQLYVDLFARSARARREGWTARTPSGSGAAARNS